MLSEDLKEFWQIYSDLQAASGKMWELSTSIQPQHTVMETIKGAYDSLTKILCGVPDSCHSNAINSCWIITGL